YTYALASGFLPPGIDMSPGGVISGTTDNTGSWSFNIRVTDSSGNTNVRGGSVFVQEEGATQANTLSIGNVALLPEASVGRHFALSMPVSVGTPTPPYSWSVYAGALPAGLSLVSGAAIGEDPNATYLYGHATTPGFYAFTLRVQDDSVRTGYKTFNQRISGLQLLPPYDSLEGFTGTPLNLTLKGTGGTPPYTFALASGPAYGVYGSLLPPGLTLNAGGTITGTTSASGIFSFQVTLSDSAGDYVTTTCSLTVYRAGSTVPLIIDGSSDGVYLGGELPPGILSSAYLLRLDPDSGVLPYGMSVNSGSLPPGLNLISGTASHRAYLVGAPSSTGSYDATVRVTDGAAQTLDVRLITEITASGLTLSPEVLPRAAVGTPYSITFMPRGGVAPYGLQLHPDSDLPPGITLSGMILSGVPTAPGRFRIELRMYDSSGMDLDWESSKELFVDSPTTPVRALTAVPSTVYVNLTTGSTPPPEPITLESGSVGLGFTAAVAGIPGASLNPSSGTAPQGIMLQLPDSLVTGTHYGVIEINSPDAVNAPLSVRLVVNVTAPPPCSYTVTPVAASIPAAGGSGSVSISAASYCSWSAVASEPWITFNSPASGSGEGSIIYQLASNPSGSARAGTITVEGQTHTITQFGSECAYIIQPTEVSVHAAGGNGTISVSTSRADCAWTASSGMAWIQLVPPAAGTGSGDVTITLQANEIASPREGTVTIAGQTLTVRQAGANCIVGLSNSGADFPASGGAGSVMVTVTNGCSYATVEGPSWITVTSGGSGSGSGTLTYSVAPNSSTMARAGSLLIGGQPYQIVQGGMACSFTVTSDNPVFSHGGGEGVITVTPNESNCGWTASSGHNWLVITPPASGTGSGQVNFSVSGNAATEGRSGSIVVAGQTVSVSQGGITCSYELRSSSGSIPAVGGTGTAGVIAAGACTWIALSNDAWLRVISAAEAGTGDVIYAADPNSAAAPRSGTLTIAGHTYTVTQPGAPCAYALPVTSAEVGPGGAPGYFNFTANQTGCTPSAVSLVDWISVSTNFSETAGTVNFTVLPTPLTGMRTGTIRLGDQVFTVRQIAAACAFSLNAYGAVFDSAGGEGSVLFSASALGCDPVIGKSPELTLETPTQDPLSSIWTQPYLVPVFDSFNLWVRILQISVSGEIFTVKQTSWR
ncbi:MAG: Serine/threonine kinase associate protein KapC, partial [Acidobacteria bacterium]|nr:Serine/threonine kinase associate protein KapC [Acidobacteriota bacterium]